MLEINYNPDIYKNQTKRQESSKATVDHKTSNSKQKYSEPNQNMESNFPFQIFKFEKGKTYENIKPSNSIIFLLNGKLLLSYNKHFKRILKAKEMIFLPQVSHLSIDAKEEAHVIYGSLDIFSQFCENCNINSLRSFCQKAQDDFYPLKIGKQFRFFLLEMESLLEQNIKCDCLFRIKSKELLCLFFAFYTKKELSLFFSSILNRNIFFKNMVLEKHNDARTVIDLAKMMNYSVSGFKKKFERYFGQSAHKWMEEQRAMTVWRDLKENKLALKEIAYKNHFSSQSRFSDFCKRVYGTTPGEIRKNIFLVF